MTDVRDIVTTRSDLSQIFQYNNPLFECFASYAYFPPTMPTRATEHWHEDLEFMYIVQGELNCMVNGHRVFLKEGEGILVNSKRIHSNNSIPGKPCAFYCGITHPTLLSFNKYIEQTYVSPLIGPNSFDYIKLTREDWTSEIIDIDLELFENTPEQGQEIAVVSGLYKIFQIITLHMEIPTAKAPKENTFKLETFRSMINYIQTNYAEKISLEDIAAAGNVGKTLCANLFKKYASKTPGEYLIFYRIQRSMILLSDTELTVSEIAYNTGFSSASHYTKTFRELMGCTPLKYRNDVHSA